jgi:hypothetical protein
MKFVHAIADSDRAFIKYLGAQPAAMDQTGEHTRLGELCQVLAGFAQAHTA